MRDLDEAKQTITDMDTNQYQQLRENVTRFSPLVKSGYYTKKLLVGTVHTILTK